MSVNQRSFTIELQSVVLHKFETLISNILPDLKDSIDITPQVGEVSIFQSIFMPTMKATISIHDEIGLLVNFPLTGDEVVSISYIEKDGFTGENNQVKKYFVIDSITAMTPGPTLREISFLINLHSFEAYFAARTRVSHSYNDSPDRIISDIMEEYVNAEIKKIYPTYPVKPIFYNETGQLIDNSVVVPNFPPLKAINWIAKQAVSLDKKNHSYVFYENMLGFHFKSIQGTFRDDAARQRAEDQKYRYISNEINSSTMKNEGRLVSNLMVNRRLSSFSKILAGYYENTFFEINMAQKAYWMKTVTNEDIETIEDNSLNRVVYENFTRVTKTGTSEEGLQEDANKVRYMINNWREDDPQFQNPEYRERWGHSLTSAAALGQIDLSVVVPGNATLQAGALFHLTLPEMHGFNSTIPDDLISGHFLITEAKHVMTLGGRHSTTLTINKDSYATSVDRASRYAANE